MGQQEPRFKTEHLTHELLDLKKDDTWILENQGGKLLNKPRRLVFGANVAEIDPATSASIGTFFEPLMVKIYSGLWSSYTHRVRIDIDFCHIQGIGFVCTNGDEWFYSFQTSKVYRDDSFMGYMSDNPICNRAIKNAHPLVSTDHEYSEDLTAEGAIALLNRMNDENCVEMQVVPHKTLRDALANIALKDDDEVEAPSEKPQKKRRRKGKKH